jgi:LPXTG-site transpeptidase (sortase) family protein
MIAATKMTKANWQRGERIARPDDFRPTATRLTPDLTLYFDYEHGYLKQVSRPDDPAPSLYYRLRPILKHRRRWVRPLRIGLVGLVAASLALILYPLYPGVQYQVQRQVSTTIGHSQAQAAAAPPVVSNTNRLIIPKLGLDANILEGSSLDVLNHQEGVWHQTGVLQNGNLVLAGHRWKYLPPNTTTFYNLKQLTTGDTVIVDWYRTRYVYIVDKTETVSVKDTKILAQTGGPRLTLYTCANVAQTLRTVVLAHMVP